MKEEILDINDIAMDARTEREKELEYQVQDLSMKLINKEQQYDELKRILDSQEENFNRIMAKLVIVLLS